MFEQIQSRQNPRIMEAVSLKDRKKRKESGLFFFEGWKLFSEAIKRNVPLVTVFATEKALEKTELFEKLPESCRVFQVTSSVYEKISEEKSPEGVFCIAKTIDKYHKFATIYNINPKKSRTLLLAVSVRDPGNLGAIIRSAAAFSTDELILSSDCADIYNSKTVRASMGCLFDLPITVAEDLPASIEALQKGNISVCATALHEESIKLPELSRNENVCFLIGNEGHGLPRELILKCDKTVFIPMSDKAESLNASVAASILLYSRYIQTV